MFTPRLFGPALQNVGRYVASTPDLLHNVKNFNQRDSNGKFSEGHSPPNLFGRFSSQFQKNEYGSFVKIVSRNFGATTLHFVREFSSNSNESSHKLLCSLPEYSYTTVKFDNTQKNIATENDIQAISLIDQHQDISLDQLVKQFKVLSNLLSNPNAIINTESISFLLRSLRRQWDDVSFSQLLEILSFAKLYQSTLSGNNEFESFMEEMEKFCFRKVKKWTLSESLLVADYWYHLNGTKSCNYLKHMQHVHETSLQYFSQSQFVQYMFYANILRDTGYVKTLTLKNKLKDILPTLSINEIGIISLALCRQSHIDLRYGRIGIIFAQRLIAEKGAAAEESIVSILKFLRSTHISDNLCFSLLESFLQEIDKHNSFVHTQLCCIASSRSLYHKEVMNKLLNSFIAHLPSVRLKDMEKFVFAAMLFNNGQADNHYILSLVVEELRKPERITEFNHFPHIFVSCVTHLTAAGVYPLDLISAVFQPSMLQYLKDTEESCSYHDIFRSIIQINCSLQIEGPSNYNGYQLNSHLRDSLTKKYLELHKNKSSFENKQRKLIVLNDSLSRFLETALSAIVNILPHFDSPDLVFCTNNEGEAVEIAESYLQQSQVHAKLPVCLEDGIKWNAVVLARTAYMLKPNNELGGSLIHKIRLLEKLGYVVSLAKPAPENLGIEKRNIYLMESLHNSTFNMNKKKNISCSIDT